MPTIAGTLRSTANRVPDADALQFGDRTRTYRELDQEVDRYAGALRDLGVRRGDRVCLMSGNSDLFVLAFYAVHRLGAVFVPVNPASAPPEVAYLVEDSGADVLLVAAALRDRVPGHVSATTLDELAAAAAVATLAARPGVRSPGNRTPLHLAPGDRVTHDTFGMGKVVRVEGEGDRAMAHVDFGGDQIKRLLLRYAPLEKL